MDEKKLASVGFEKTKPDTERAWVISISGETSSGKTTFALTAPKPHAFFNFDHGEARAISGIKDKLDVDKDGNIDGLYIKTFYPPSVKVSSRFSGNVKSPLREDSGGVQEDNIKNFVPLYRDFNEAYNAVLCSGLKYATIDDGGDLWEIVRLAYLGQVTEVMPQHYVEVNAVWKSIIQRARYRGVNLIITHKLKDVYVGNSCTGERTLDGFSKDNFLSDISLLTSWDKKKKQPEILITKCGPNKELEGITISGDMCTYTMLKALILDCDPEDVT